MPSFSLALHYATHFDIIRRCYPTALGLLSIVPALVGYYRLSWKQFFKKYFCSVSWLLRGLVIYLVFGCEVVPIERMIHSRVSWTGSVRSIFLPAALEKKRRPRLLSLQSIVVVRYEGKNSEKKRVAFYCCCDNGGAEKLFILPKNGPPECNIPSGHFRTKELAACFFEWTKKKCPNPNILRPVEDFLLNH